MMRIILSLIAILSTAVCSQAIAEDNSHYYGLADTAYTAGNYQEALDHYQTAHASPDAPPADVLYNMGNCYYRLDQPGLAALYYHRALYKNPKHHEAIQNLNLLTDKYGIITAPLDWWEEYLAKVPPGIFRHLRVFGIWLIPLSLLYVLAYFRKKRAILVGVLGGLSAILFIGTATAALHYYPTDPRVGEHLPDASKTIVTTSTPATIRTDPMKSAAPLADLPPGTLCQMLSPRGNWSYIQTPSRQRAWIPSKDIAPLIPSTKPTSPKEHNYF